MNLGRLLAICVALLLGGMALGAFARMKREQRDLSCLSNLYNLSNAMMFYSSDYGAYPDATQWLDTISDGLGRGPRLKCPLDGSSARCSYAMNVRLSGKRLQECDDLTHTAVLYETKRPGDNPAGDASDVVAPPRHLYGNAYGFGDGPARWSTRVPRFEP